MRLLAGLAVTVSLVLVGAPSQAAPPKSNGVATLSPAKALSKSDKAMSKLSDAYYTGTETTSQLTGTLGVFKASQLYTKSYGCDINIHSGKGSIRTIVSGKYSYGRGSSSFYVQQGTDPGIAAFLGGRWVKAKATKGEKAGCLTKNILPSPGLWSSFVGGGLTKVKGKQARLFTMTTDDGQTIAFWIATKGEPYLLKFTTTDTTTGDSSSYVLKAKGKGTKVKAPRGAKTISQWANS